MKYFLFTSSLFFLFGFVFTMESKETINNNHELFSLSYYSAGLGSNMGSMQPTFRVTGTKFLYTFEQNSYYGSKTRQPDTICTGNLRTTSIDSIIELVSDIEDTLVYTTNVNIASGGIQGIRIKSENVSLSFRMHNASHPTAEKIVAILNSNIPENKPKLWLNDF